ncbi:hypothetical protein COU18_03775 [Candidatus Kaiserbacteria bacterium CG10_big_fil_rev_8_21_14_0_10_51_14]|uniref:Uncharacterized protein n=1 Tax=Candidatus Kaiserbacteria bacterium CG10_big_fil_rev_8_21_14_0_10_51_14 TaxID=1974610 RepID=A0A2H0UBG1_9BACT|nr:MAG: hypothetical protein COU18_03775 [Candidatus Kaiserbacteria bacterium CG10_big_fil_rev_8_21_14_0_10_51_14]
MDNQIEEIHDEIAGRVNRGDEKGAMEYLKGRFSELPEEVQGEILTRAYLHALEQETARLEKIADIQDRALTALTVLDVLKEELEKEAGNS